MHMQQTNKQIQYCMHVSLLKIFNVANTTAFTSKNSVPGMRLAPLLLFLFFARFFACLPHTTVNKRATFRMAATRLLHRTTNLLRQQQQQHLQQLQPLSRTVRLFSGKIKQNLDWEKLEFGFIRTNAHVEYTNKNDTWDSGVLKEGELISDDVDQ